MRWPSPPAAPSSGARWVATPPGGDRPPTPLGARHPYRGPPSYPVMPRWGFPRVGWRRPVLFTASAPSDAERMRVLAGSVVPVLWLVAVVAAVAAGAELWRLTILPDNRLYPAAGAPPRASAALVV